MSRLLAVAAAAALALTACSGSSDSDASASPTVGDISMITVEQSETLAPSLAWPAGVDFTSTQSKVMWQGEGEMLVDGQPLLLDMYVQSLATGQVIENTYDGLPRSFLLAPELLGDDLYTVLLGASVGTRVLSVAPPVGEFEDEPAIVIVIDVLSDHAVGERLPVDETLPKVSVLPTGEPEVVIDPEQVYSPDLEIATLVQGDGPQVVPGSFIVAQIKVVYGTDGEKDTKSWKAGDVRQTSWLPEQAPFEGQVGVGKLLRALDEGLIDQTAGSQVLLVAPEEWAYPGEGPLVIVIDILDVWNQEP
ncbi:FKBP-type peptidyl-prolyl cis-trans isomerase [Demequina sp. TTPB684]|uniref:FKBP-type peptidyl-prolyl cis-trans isomerase n=1 Tax=unclassified Demequina TaxID=2620311 RepID=UPI001CF2485A|nr:MULTISPECIES: FKBP-type peptidyl-prolyl cis-trans isomerase [unclassified Demequina]MCB2413927.1 FKBP-type peptidyl-prolyl cis-trans isomerase [Demequina sp. TTPB684]UPU89385.1 FKBP-type peptidyl-prolyl cis-trans isomerase [Demequina sp. TMPB413]